MGNRKGDRRGVDRGRRPSRRKIARRRRVRARRAPSTSFLRRRSRPATSFPPPPQETRASGTERPGRVRYYRPAHPIPSPVCPCHCYHDGRKIKDMNLKIRNINPRSPPTTPRRPKVCRLQPSRRTPTHRSRDESPPDVIEKEIRSPTRSTGTNSFLPSASEDDSDLPRRFHLLCGKSELPDLDNPNGARLPPDSPTPSLSRFRRHPC